MLCPCTYPRLRERGPDLPLHSGELYDRYEGPRDEIGVPDALTEVFRFSGRPDSIVLAVRANDCWVTLMQRGSTEQHEILVLESTPMETHFGAEIILARNRVAGTTAQLNILGKWAARARPPAPEAGNPAGPGSMSEMPGSYARPWAMGEGPMPGARGGYPMPRGA